MRAATECDTCVCNSHVVMHNISYVANGSGEVLGPVVCHIHDPTET